MNNRKLGRQARKHGNLPHYSQMRRAVRLPIIPDTLNWLDGMPGNFGMMKNDTLGDCSCAGLHHARQVWTYNANGTVMTTDADRDVLADYEAACGYVPGDESTDQGGCLQDVLAYTVKTGITTDGVPDKLAAYFEIDPRIQLDIREVIALAGVAYIGIKVKESWTASDAGAVWDASDEVSAGGHCVILAGYNKDGFDVISWGTRFRLTNAGFAQVCDEAYGLVDRNWIEKTGLTPGGISVDQLEAAMRSMRE